MPTKRVRDDNGPSMETRRRKFIREETERETFGKTAGLDIFAELLCSLSNQDFIKNALLVSKGLYHHVSVQKRLNEIKMQKLGDIFGPDILTRKKNYFQAARIIKKFEPRTWEFATKVSNIEYYSCGETMQQRERLSEVVIGVSIDRDVAKTKHIFANMRHDLYPYIPGREKGIKIHIDEIKDSQIIGKERNQKHERIIFLHLVKKNKCLFYSKEKKFMNNKQPLDMEKLAIVYIHADVTELKWLASGRWEPFF